jgi:hypothetical protein
MEKLIRIIPPPENPLNTGSNVDWENFITNLGTDLPSDYKKFIETYGTGGIDNFLWILTPFVSDENINFLKKQKELSDAYLQSKQNFPQYYKHDVFPQKGGLLPWAYTDNGDELYWLTDGEPFNWKIIVYESRSPENHTYSLTMTEFLYQILTRELVCDAFPDDFPSDEPQFISVNVE